MKEADNTCAAPRARSNHSYTAVMAMGGAETLCDAAAITYTPHTQMYSHGLDVMLDAR